VLAGLVVACACRYAAGRLPENEKSAAVKNFQRNFSAVECRNSTTTEKGKKKYNHLSKPRGKRS